MKATAKASADTALTATPSSIKDAGYRFAVIGETASGIARYVMTQAPEFPAEVSTELKADLYAGFMTRAHEL